MSTAVVEAEVEVHNEQTQFTSKKTPPVKDPDLEGSNSFTEVTEGDQVKFECNICQKRLNKVVGVKNHIRMMHIRKEPTQKPTASTKRKKAADFFGEDDDIKKARLEDSEDDTEDFMKKIDEYWNKSMEEANTNSELDENTNETMSQSMLSPPAEQETHEISNLDTARTVIESLRQDVEVAKSNAAEDKFKIESLEEAIKTKNETIDVYKTTINSHEVDQLKKETCINRSKDVFKTLEKKIVALEKSVKDNTNNEQTKKIKKLEDEVKKLKREANDKERKLKETISKLNYETQIRSKAEAEVTRVNKQANNLTKILENKEERERNEEKQRNRSPRDERQRNRSPRDERFNRNGPWREEQRNGGWHPRNEYGHREEVRRREGENRRMCYEQTRRESDDKRRRESNVRRRTSEEEYKRRLHEEQRRERRGSREGKDQRSRSNPDFVNTLAETLVSLVDAQRDTRPLPAPAAAGRRH